MANLDKNNMDIVVDKAKRSSGVNLYIKVKQNITEAMFFKIKKLKNGILLHIGFSNNIDKNKVELIFNSLKVNQEDFLKKFEVTNWSCRILIRNNDEENMIRRILNLKYDTDNWEIVYIID